MLELIQSDKLFVFLGLEGEDNEVGHFSFMVILNIELILLANSLDLSLDVLSVHLPIQEEVTPDYCLDYY